MRFAATAAVVVAAIGGAVFGAASLAGTPEETRAAHDEPTVAPMAHDEPTVAPMAHDMRR